MTLKEKFQEHKDLRKVRKEASALKDVQNQTNEIVFEAFRYHGLEAIPFIRNLTPELYIKLEIYCEEYLLCSESILSVLPEERITQEICVEAVKWSLLLFDDVPEKFRTYDLYLTYVKKTGHGLEEVPEEYRTAELYNAAVEADAIALQWVPKDFQTDDMYEAAFRENDSRIREHRATFNLLQYMHNQTEEICLRGVEQNGMSLKDAKYQNDEICLAAVKNNGLALQYVKNQTKEICFAAVDEDIKSLMYIHDMDLAQLTALYANAKNVEEQY